MKTHKERFLEGEPFRMDGNNVKYDTEADAIYYGDNYYCTVYIHDDHIMLMGRFLNEWLEKKLLFDHILFKKEYFIQLEERLKHKMHLRENRKGGSHE